MLYSVGPIDISRMHYKIVYSQMRGAFLRGNLKGSDKHLLVTAKAYYFLKFERFNGLAGQVISRYII